MTHVLLVGAPHLQIPTILNSNERNFVTFNQIFLLVKGIYM